MAHLLLITALHVGISTMVATAVKGSCDKHFEHKVFIFGFLYAHVHQFSLSSLPPVYQDIR